MTDGAIINMDPDHVLLIDLSWTNSDLMGLSCPFCRQVLDWEGLKSYGSGQGSMCPHLEFASTECLPFDENVSQIAERIRMLKQSYDLFQKDFIDGFDLEQSWNSNDSKTTADMDKDAERIDQFSQEIISSLKDGHSFVSPYGYYARYIEFVENGLQYVARSIHEWIEWSGTAPVGQEEIDALVDDAMFEINDIPRHAIEFMRAEEEAIALSELRLQQEDRIRDELNQGPDGVWMTEFDSRLPNFDRFCHEMYKPGVISIFMARTAMSDRCWCVIYSTSPSATGVSDPLDAPNTSPTVLPDIELDAPF